MSVQQHQQHMVPAFCKKRHYEKPLRAYRVPFRDLPEDTFWLQRLEKAVCALPDEPQLSRGEAEAQDDADVASQQSFWDCADSLSEADIGSEHFADPLEEQSASSDASSDVGSEDASVALSFLEDGSDASAERAWSIAWMGRSPMLVRRCQAALTEDTAAASLHEYSMAVSAALLPPRALREHSDHDIDAVVEETLKRRHSSCAVLALNAGYFAGAVFSDGKVVVHKTFHRYTTRKKQGGSQSSFDAGGRKAKSAGSNLRRYGEQRLQEEVEEVLTQTWAAELAGCEHVYISVSNRMRSKLVGSKEAPFVPHSKVRSLPFVLGRPTHEAVREAYSQLSSLFFAASEHAFRTTREREAKRQSATSMQCSKDSTASALHLAAADGDADLILALLQGGADPTLVDEEGKVPYELCSQGRTRRGQGSAAWAFQYWREQQPDDACDWTAAKIPKGEDSELPAAAEQRKSRRRSNKQDNLQPASRSSQEPHGIGGVEGHPSDYKGKSKDAGKGKGRCQGKADKGHAAPVSQPGARVQCKAVAPRARTGEAHSGKRGGKNGLAARGRALL
eukprot:TRINITY_DN19543_c0_g1_i1.p1 TRINITY_DN19543_c0_g1~~TRINITY_DN19543_c0_g1_i1.p1  ORF type:complete len:585 (-),score=131.82 TRINITY_DN19543_c0_g1_i1:106-1794(-)